MGGGGGIRRISEGKESYGFQGERKGDQSPLTEEKEAFHTPEVKPNPMNSSHGYEFGGPVGVCLMMIGLPAMVIASYLFCNKDGCSIHQRPSIPQVWSFTGGFFDIGHLIVLGWIIFQAIIYMLPIGKVTIYVL